MKNKESEIKNVEIINVLWIDDEYKKFENKIEVFWETAIFDPVTNKYFSLFLHTFDNWKAGETFLDNSNLEFSAMILDAHCKYDEHTDPEDQDFVQNAFGEAREKKIPFYVFSAGVEKAKSLQTFRYRDGEVMKDWEDQTGRKFYKKENEEEELALKTAIIKTHIGKKDWQIKNTYYPEVFHAIREMGEEQNVEKNLVSLLLPINFPENNWENYLQRATLLRDCMEHLYRQMASKGILPPELVEKDFKDNISINACFQFLINYKLIPRFLYDTIGSAKNLVSFFHHTKKSEMENFYSYSYKNNSPYILMSLSLWMCDFILWLSVYIRNNPDSVKNRQKWIQDYSDFKIGKLFWDKNKGRWYVFTDKRKYKLPYEKYYVDNDEDAKDKSKYIKEMRCKFLIKEIRQNNDKDTTKSIYYAYCISKVDNSFPIVSINHYHPI